MQQIDPKIFKAYDIRGIYPDQINTLAVYDIVQAYVRFLKPTTVVVGRDVRLSGAELAKAAISAFTDMGVDVVDIGIVSTDMMYFAVAEYGYDGGIIISASHNPKEYNGLKMVRKGALPISGDTGIEEIKNLAMQKDWAEFKKGKTQGEVTQKNIQAEYLQKCLSFVDVTKINPLRVVANGMFGPAVQNVIKMKLPIHIVPLNELPDGNFPKGAPDPLLEENRKETVEWIKNEKVDLGAAWDADADRFFLFDENGRWIPGYYITAFLGEYYSRKNPGTKVIYDTRLTWATIEKVKSADGIPLQNKAGHSFIKERMRKEDASFGGEMSGHYYFKDFYYADNGLVPFLLILQIVSESGQKVSELFDEYFEKFHISGEINSELQSLDLAKSIFDRIRSQYSDAKFDETDGLSIEYSDWRANIRGSNTQPLLRLNVEARSEALMKQKTEELLQLIKK